MDPLQNTVLPPPVMESSVTALALQNTMAVGQGPAGPKGDQGNQGPPFDDSGTLDFTLIFDGGLI